MNEGMREGAILWEGKPDAGFFGGRGSLTVSQFEIGIVMQDGEVVDIFSSGKRNLPRKGEVRTYVASTSPFTLTFWLMDPMDREEPDDGVVLGQLVLTSDDEAVTGRLALTMRVVRENVEHLMKLLRPGSGGVTRQDVSDVIKDELLDKVLALDIHRYTAEELRGNRELFRGIYDSVNTELASTIRFYGLRLDNFTVNWGLTSEERERIRERRHEEELREIRRRQEIEDLANRARERQGAEQLGEIERRKEREWRYEEELRELRRQREVVEREQEILEKQRELMEGRRGLADLSESVQREPPVPPLGPPDAPGVPDETERVSSLHEAVWRDDTEVALALVKSGINVNSRNESGTTALHYAAIRDHTETIRALLSAGADVNVRDEDGRTPLSWAAMLGNTAGVLALLSAGADVNARGGSGHTPLHWAAIWGNAETARVLAVAGDDVDVMDGHRLTPLHWAALNGHTETTMVMVSSGADVNARSGLLGRTALHLAAVSGHTETGRALVAAGADVGAIDDEGSTPWLLAYAMGHLETEAAILAVPRGCLSGPGKDHQETERPSSSLREGVGQVDAGSIGYEEWRSKLMEKLESTGGGQTTSGREPVGGERYGVSYWVYEDRVTSNARVHKETCGHCNYGAGRGHGRIPGDSEWHGPYASRAEAFLRAEATGQKEVRGCGHCRP